MTDNRFRDDDQLETIYSVTNPLEADLIKNLLLHHDINCQLDGELQAGLAGALEIGVLVLKSDADEARKIMEHHHVDRKVKSTDGDKDTKTHPYHVQGGIYEGEESINAFRLDH